MKFRIIALIGLLVVAVAGAGYLGFRSTQADSISLTPTPPVTVPVTRGDIQQTVTAPGLLEGTRQARLELAVGGRLAELNARPGDAVRAGAVLARLETDSLELAVQSAQAELAQKEASLRALSQPASPEDVAAARAAVASAQAKLADTQAGPSDEELTQLSADMLRKQITLKQAQWAYDQVAYRGDVGAMPQASSLEQATIDYQEAQAAYKLAVKGPSEADVASARLQLAQAESALADKLRGPGEAELAGAQAAVDAARVQLAKAERDRAAAALTAPFDGVVLEVKANPGEIVAAGSELISLADTAAVEVRATVTEEDWPLVQVGQPVELFFDARPDVTITGRVARIVPQRDAEATSPVYPIAIALDGPPSGLAPGMTVDASVVVARRADVLRLPRALVRARADGTAQVKVWVDGHSEERSVKVGLRGDQDVEIVAGLSEGEQVVGR
jgi:HlyD family secretion protein